ncbi:MAG: exodeoxyribonuclease VII small subunit [Clostridia bacterium]|nr:exodeoxyribonuclease VII small subunit [Clostridia bacterium]
MSFEELVKRLEEIVERMESGEAKLDEVNKLFSEGAEITKQCYQMLNDTKGKITVLREEMAKLVEKPLNE